MATAYTSLLGLALPVTGELSGTWGATVNDEITALLDSAVAGTTSITADADITLSDTDGAANETRQAVILWNPATGTTTRNITAPARSKAYIVINASGGTQSIVLRGAGPTTGVTIIKGEKALCAWDGSDFVKVANQNGIGNFTTVDTTNLEVTNLKALDGTAAGSIANSTGVVTLASSVLTTTDINGGTIDGTAIGGASAAAGAFTTLSATGVTTVQAGTAAAPAITTTGDTNTGIFFPAADTIAFSEGGVESARFDSSGNFGVGVTPTNNTLGKTVQVGQSTVLTADASANLFWLGSNWYYNSGDKYIANGFSTLYSQQSGTHQWFTAPSGTAGNAITFTQAMTLDASGWLGIGQTSPQYPLHITGASGVQSYAHFTNATTGNTASDGFSIGVPAGSSDAYILQRESANLFFYTNAAERARITSGGVFMVGATTAHSFGIPSIQAGGSNGNALISVYRNDTSLADQVIFYNPNGLVGRIQTDGSATAYVTSSDYRLKENITPMTGALSKVALLKPVTYKWKVDGSDSQGFIAHELAEVAPYAVSGEKDGEQMQGVDYGKLTPILTAALQEAIAKIEVLEARISALEAK
jgi:hypothetical protein